MTPGVILSMEFDLPGKREFKNYLDYMDRPESQTGDKFFIPEENSFGLFTQDLDILTEGEKEVLNTLFAQGEERGSILWKPVLSFDTKWAKENGVLKESGEVNQNLLMQATRRCMGNLLKRENLENAIWTGAIHVNTDNIHVHMAVVEPTPQRERMANGEIRGKMKESHLNLSKSAGVNAILTVSKEHEKLNELVRETILNGKRPLVKDRAFENKLKALEQVLPEKTGEWHYNYNSMAKARPLIDQLSQMYLDKYHKEDMVEFQENLKKQEDKYREAYGGNSGRFVENKIQDLHERLGNAILRELREEFRQQNISQMRKNSENQGKVKATLWGTKRDMNKLSKRLGHFVKIELNNQKNINQRAYDDLQYRIEEEMLK